MLKVKQFNEKGLTKEEFSLPKEFGSEFNLNLIAQAVRVYKELSHVGLRKAQTRSEVNRTHKKVYKQKGTGGARHGSRNAPIFVGGGVAHGPRPLRRAYSISKSIKLKALVSALVYKAKMNKLVVVENVSKIKKSSDAAKIFEKIGADIKSTKFVFAYAKKGDNLAFRNLKNIETVLYSNLNAWTVVKSQALVIDESVFKIKTK